MTHINHKWSLQDFALFYEGRADIAITIGALSYVEGMDVFDYTTSMPQGQPQGKLYIGRAVSIGSNVSVHLYGEHNHSRITSSPLLPLIVPQKLLPPEPQQITRIENDVWIANGVRILSGVTIGNGAVVGANSLVTKDIPPYAIAVGTPAKVIKYRFTEEQIEKLLAIEWWNWELDKIQNEGENLLGFNIDDFINKHYPPPR